jgi:hypothetical protein
MAATADPESAPAIDQFMMTSKCKDAKERVRVALYFFDAKSESVVISGVFTNVECGHCWRVSVSI